MNWWSGLAEKYLVTTGSILGACHLPAGRVGSLPPPCLKGSAYTLFPLDRPVITAPDGLPAPIPVPFNPLSVCTIFNAQGGQHDWGTCLRSHSFYVAGAGLTPRSAGYQRACLSPLAKPQVHFLTHGLCVLATFLVLSLRLPRLGLGVRRRNLLARQPRRFSYS